MNHRPHPRPPQGNGTTSPLAIMDGFVPHNIMVKMPSVEQPDGTTRPAGPLEALAYAAERITAQARMEAAQAGHAGALPGGWFAVCADNLRHGWRVRWLAQSERPTQGPWPEAASFGGAQGGPENWIGKADIPPPPKMPGDGPTLVGADGRAL